MLQVLFSLYFIVYVVMFIYLLFVLFSEGEALWGLCLSTGMSQTFSGSQTPSRYVTNTWVNVIELHLCLFINLTHHEKLTSDSFQH